MIKFKFRLDGCSRLEFEGFDEVEGVIKDDEHVAQLVDRRDGRWRFGVR